MPSALLRDVGRALLGVRRVRVDRRGDRVVEEELGRELEPAVVVRVGADLEVDVHGAAAVPARVDRLERGRAGRVGHLVAAQEVLAARVEARDPPRPSRRPGRRSARRRRARPRTRCAVPPSMRETRNVSASGRPVADDAGRAGRSGCPSARGASSTKYGPSVSSGFTMQDGRSAGRAEASGAADPSWAATREPIDTATAVAPVTPNSARTSRRVRTRPTGRSSSSMAGSGRAVRMAAPHQRLSSEHEDRAQTRRSHPRAMFGPRKSPWRCSASGRADRPAIRVRPGLVRSRSPARRIEPGTDVPCADLLG